MKTLQTQQRLDLPLSTRATQMQFLLYLPRDYQMSGSARWPLLLFLHGAGERGRRLSLVATHGPPKIAPQQPDFPFIVVSPQCPQRQLWSNELLIPLLDHVMDTYSVDRRRVYITGLSMGGYGVWNLAVAYPERFAAAVPVCGGGDILAILLAEPAKLRRLRALPVWAFHGAKDPVVPVQESERMIDALRQIGNPAKLTVYPNVEHDSWTETYANPELYSWFLKQRRP